MLHTRTSRQKGQSFWLHLFHVFHTDVQSLSILAFHATNRQLFQNFLETTWKVLTVLFIPRESDQLYLVKTTHQSHHDFARGTQAKFTFQSIPNPYSIFMPKSPGIDFIDGEHSKICLSPCLWSLVLQMREIGLSLRQKELMESPSRNLCLCFEMRFSSF